MSLASAEKDKKVEKLDADKNKAKAK